MATPDAPTPPECAVTGCPHPPSGSFTWGLYPDGEHNKDQPLCQPHADELWERLQGLVTAQKAHFVAAPLPS